MSWWMCAQIDPLPAASPPAPQETGEQLVRSFEHSWPWPSWITLLFLLAGAGLIMLVYLREQGGASRVRRLLLAGVRITLLLLVTFMLYGWTRQLHRMDLPDLVIALDNSASLAVVDQDPDEGVRNQRRGQVRAAGFDQPLRFNLARTLLLQPDRGWLEFLANDYRIKLFTMGESARALGGDAASLKDAVRELQPTGAASRLGMCLRDILDAQRGRPTAAVILLTDGVTTEGQTLGDAAELARRKSIPLFLVGIGSERPPHDLRLSDLLVDDVVFVDEIVNFDAQLHADGYAGRSAVLRLTRRDRTDTLAEQTVTVPEDGSALAVRLSYRPQEEGEFEHVLEVLPAEEEVNVENNRLSQRITVRNATLRVLLAQAYPSYEYRFLKDLLARATRPGKEGTAKAIQLTTVLQEADLEYVKQDPSAQSVFPVNRDELFAYDVLIFGDVNPAFLGASVMQHVVDFVMERGGGVMFLCGPQFTPLAYRDTPLAALLPIDPATAAIPAADQLLKEPSSVRPTPLGLSAPQMQLGDTAAESERVWPRLPGLHWLLSAPDVRPAARVLAVQPQRVGPQGEPLPVILLQFVGAGKVILHTTDETYRWSRYPGSDQYYSRYWLQSLRYLSRSKLETAEQLAEITTDRQQYRRGETVRLRVRFFQERQAPAEDDGVVLLVQQLGGRRQQVTLERDAIRRDLFEGSLGGLTDGQYRVWLAASSEQAVPRTFTVAPPPGEQARLTLDAPDLRKAAKTARGAYAPVGEAQRLLPQLPRGRRVTIESLPPEPLWNSSLVAASFVLLVSLEWLLRKRSGML